MFSAAFSLLHHAGLTDRTLTHLSKLGLLIDGKPLQVSNRQMKDYLSASPERVVRVSANSGNAKHDRYLVQYAKATIQSGDGPFREVAHPMSPQRQHVAAALKTLEADPDWAPYLRIGKPSEETQREEKDEEEDPDPDSQPGGHDNPQEPYEDWQEKEKKSAMPGAPMEEPVPGAASPMQDQDIPGHEEREEAGVRDWRVSEFQRLGFSPETAMELAMSGVDLEAFRKIIGQGATPDQAQRIVSRMQRKAVFYDNSEGDEDSQSRPGKERRCPGCDRSVTGDMKTCPECGTSLSKPKDSGWHEAGPMDTFRMQRGDNGPAGAAMGQVACPQCGAVNQPGATQCMKCGSPLQRTSKITITPPVTGKMTRWHLADGLPTDLGQVQPDLPGGGDFGDHSRVDRMGPEQAVAHQHLVEYVVNELNGIITNDGVIDDSALDAIKNTLVNKFGIPIEEAQTIVDLAVRQTQNLDGTLDTPMQQDPSDAAAQAADQGNAVGTQLPSDPNQAVNNGAFSHVRTPSGRIGHVVDQWEDMYGERWAMVSTVEGYKESVYEDDLTPTDSPGGEDPVSELEAFIDSFEPVTPSYASIRARMANVKAVKSEIRRHMQNPRLSMTQKLALDKLDSDMSVDLLALTDAVQEVGPTEQAYLNAQPTYEPSLATDVQPTMYGVPELATPEAPEPEWSSEALEAFTPEEAEVLVSELPGEIRTDPNSLAYAASAHIDSLTAGHAADIRAYHRTRFIEAVHQIATDYQLTDEPDTIESAVELEDGPAEGIFS